LARGRLAESGAVHRVALHGAGVRDPLRDPVRYTGKYHASYEGWLPTAGTMRIRLEKRLPVDTLVRTGIRNAWDTLTNAQRLGRLFWDCTVESDFTAGSPIVWKGTWDGKPFEDRGRIRQVKPRALLQYSHWAPSSGADAEENHNLLTWRLAEEKSGVRVTLQHENIASAAMKEHSQQMWTRLLARVKELLENQAGEQAEQTAKRRQEPAVTPGRIAIPPE
jgi:Activator of Hsp90 ATPase homolog 1-like protein